MSVLVSDIAGNRQKLDGGALFGNAPKTLWERWFTPDDKNRIETACRAALIQVEGLNVLLETGIGAFFEPAMKARFGVVETEHVLLDSLAARGLTDEDIDWVILSHLHFDHAGGLLSGYEPGRSPELLFPKARFLTSEAAFERAGAPHARDRASFIKELPGLLQQSHRLELLPATADCHPELPEAFSFKQTSGHTPGMLHTLVSGPQHQLVFCADLIPGVAWLNPALTMGYDRFAEQVADEKLEQLNLAVSQGDWLFFTHDTNICVTRVQRGERGRFETVAEAATLDSWDLAKPSFP